jgi:SnoaL-like polyketide cyclase
MSTEENKTLIRRLFEEGLNQNKPGVFDELIAPNFVIYGAPGEMQPGPEGFRQGIETFRKSFPDNALLWMVTAAW